MPMTISSKDLKGSLKRSSIPNILEHPNNPAALFPFIRNIIMAKQVAAGSTWWIRSSFRSVRQQGHKNRQEALATSYVQVSHCGFSNSMCSTKLYLQHVCTNYTYKLHVFYRVLQSTYEFNTSDAIIVQVIQRGTGEHVYVCICMGSH